ncbi:DUF6124 family protein [Pseudomonas sp. TH15]|uniref:DUF6124 family protein n=1 Tax=Pseudomonas sp. TH15 TaxID=2796381 RepID=UPI001913ADBB|nr:hypothetical protein [Pseudomonas sp. TH15]MBK5511698.1 hypothetical protein [Pseudomonas sp. TH15]
MCRQRQQSPRFGQCNAHQLRPEFDKSHRKTAFGIAQNVMLGELAVNQALDSVKIAL